MFWCDIGIESNNEIESFVHQPTPKKLAKMAQVSGIYFSGDRVLNDRDRAPGLESVRESHFTG